MDSPLSGFCNDEQEVVTQVAACVSVLGRFVSSTTLFSYLLPLVRHSTSLTTHLSAEVANGSIDLRKSMVSRVCRSLVEGKKMIL